MLKLHIGEVTIASPGTDYGKQRGMFHVICGKMGALFDDVRACSTEIDFLYDGHMTSSVSFEDLEDAYQQIKAFMAEVRK